MSNNTDILAPFLPKIMDGLLTMATQSTDDVLALVLESLRIVMSVRWLLHQPSSQTFSLKNCEGWVGKPWKRSCCCLWLAPVVTDRHKPSRKCGGREQWLWKMTALQSLCPPIYFFLSFLARFFLFLFFSLVNFPLPEPSDIFTNPLSIRPTLQSVSVLLAG